MSNWCNYYGSTPTGELHAKGGGPACESNDGGRQPVLRYDTPAIGPASIAVSTGDNDYWDIMLKVAGSFGDAGYITTASASVAFGQGTSVTVSWSQDDVRDGEYHYMKADHSYGDGSVGVYYKSGERGTGAAKTEGSLWGIGIGHHIGGGADVFAGYRQISEDKMKDVDLLVAGMRVSFN